MRIFGQAYLGELSETADPTALPFTVAPVNGKLDGLPPHISPPRNTTRFETTAKSTRRDWQMRGCRSSFATPTLWSTATLISPGLFRPRMRSFGFPSTLVKPRCRHLLARKPGPEIRIRASSTLRPQLSRVAWRVLGRPAGAGHAEVRGQARRPAVSITARLNQRESYRWCDRGFAAQHTSSARK